MKKIISLALCIVMICLALVSCEDVIGEDLHKEGGLYEQGLQSNVSDPLAELDFYIVVSDDVDLSDNDVAAQYNTVQTQLNAELKDLYNVKLYIHYVNEKDYDAEIKKAVQPGYNRDGKGRSETADLILINSKSLYDELVADDMLLALDSQLAKNAYGMLNARITKSLWDATKTEINGEFYQFVVPNNRLVGEYTYLLLDRAEVQYHSYSEPAITHGNYFCKKCNYTYNTSKAYSLNYEVMKNDGNDKYEATVGTMHFAAGTTLDEAYSMILENEGAVLGDSGKFISKINCLNSECSANLAINHYTCTKCGEVFDGSVANFVDYTADVTKTTTQEFVTVETVDGNEVELINKVVIVETVDSLGQSNKITTVEQTYETDEGGLEPVVHFYGKSVTTEVIAKDSEGKVKLTVTKTVTATDGKETVTGPTVTDAELVDISEWSGWTKDGNSHGVVGEYKNSVVDKKVDFIKDFCAIKKNLSDTLNDVISGKGKENQAIKNDDGVEIGKESYVYTAEVRTISCWDASTPFEETFELSRNFRMIDLMDVNSEDLQRIFKDMYGNDWEVMLEKCIVTGTYADKAYYENGSHTEEEGDAYYCNIMAYPQITSEEAFESAFAVVRDSANSLRCMDLIKALNIDEKIRNLLQFGKESVNYVFAVDPVTKEKTVVPIDGNEYIMNPDYTGNIFTMYYVGDEWNSTVASWASKHNEESVFVKEN